MQVLDNEKPGQILGRSPWIRAKRVYDSWGIGGRCKPLESFWFLELVKSFLEQFVGAILDGSIEIKKKQENS